MASSFKILTPQDLDQVETEKQSFALHVLEGLSQIPKRLSSRYFYDDRGSKLFEKIMELPEYYPTNCEFEVLRSHQNEIAEFVRGEHFHLVELGAGDGRKTGILLQHFLERSLDFRYVPIDISQAAMEELIERLNKKFPALNSSGYVCEYFTALKWLNQMTDHRNFVLFLGSNLGNFNRSRARTFLRHLWNTLNDGDFVMIGFDLKKDIDTMLDAYNDSQGVTAAFNLNLLQRINTELGGNFNLKKFRHYATYDVFSGAMESYLVSMEAQTVFIEAIGQRFSFDPWEPIHTEYSYKYLESDIEQLAADTGFEIVHQFYDSKKYFLDSLWQVRKIDPAN